MAGAFFVSLQDRESVVGAGKDSLLGDRRGVQLRLYGLSAHQLDIPWDNFKGTKNI